QQLALVNTDSGLHAALLERQDQSVVGLRHGETVPDHAGFTFGPSLRGGTSLPAVLSPAQNGLGLLEPALDRLLLGPQRCAQRPPHISLSHHDPSLRSGL